MREENGREGREKPRETETGGGKRGIYSGTGFLSAVSLTMLCKAKVVANFQIHLHTYTFMVYNGEEKYRLNIEEKRRNDIKKEKGSGRKIYLKK